MTGSLDAEVNGQPVRIEFLPPGDSAPQGEVAVVWPTVRAATRSVRAFRAADRMTRRLRTALVGWYEPRVSVRAGRLPSVRGRWTT